MAAVALAACQPLQTPDAESDTHAVSELRPAAAPVRRADPATAAAARAYVDLMRNGAAQPEPDDTPGDLIERLRAGFALPVIEDAQVASERSWFAGQQAYIDRVFERAAPFLHFIVEELDARGLPADYALLPVIESAFDPLAYSHGRAAGLWQIIPGTGRRFGLQQNWWYDGRRDVVESTRAALDYLEYLHGLFDGDWLLATAAYNAGEGSVSRAIRRAEAANQATDFWSLRRHLPRETRTYVPRLLALRDVIAAPEQHGIVMPEIPDTPHLAVVETGGQIDLAIAASLAGLEAEQLHRLNPGVNRWATNPEGPHQLVVPLEHAEVFSAAFATLAPHERMQWARHRIEPGDTLIAIAARYQTTVDVLRETNQLRGHLIRAGDHLMVPLSQAALANGSAPQVIAAAANGAGPQLRQVTYTVRRGDSLYSIAQRFRVTITSLVEWNQVSAERYLQPGQRLTLYVNVADQSS
jgi:membrane-bound lytic murein transglycosylase D